MNQNPYATGAPGVVQRTEAHVAGRILAPLLVPLGWVPLVWAAAVGVLIGRVELPLAGFAFLNTLPLALMGLPVIVVVVMLALLPFRYMRWPRRALWAALAQAALVVMLAAGLAAYFHAVPGEDWEGPPGGAMPASAGQTVLAIDPCGWAC